MEPPGVLVEHERLLLKPTRRPPVTIASGPAPSRRQVLPGVARERPAPDALVRDQHVIGVLELHRAVVRAGWSRRVGAPRVEHVQHVIGRWPRRDRRPDRRPRSRSRSPRRSPTSRLPSRASFACRPSTRTRRSCSVGEVRLPGARPRRQRELPGIGAQHHHARVARHGDDVVARHAELADLGRCGSAATRRDRSRDSGGSTPSAPPVHTSSPASRTSL